ncbi:MAG: hypothetical protein NTZ71_01445 [Planctomycetota bacterium]|nr:hypothetical protein [Planctomycetota bacterium]
MTKFGTIGVALVMALVAGCQTSGTAKNGSGHGLFSACKHKNNTPTAMATPIYTPVVMSSSPICPPACAPSPCMTTSPCP